VLNAISLDAIQLFDVENGHTVYRQLTCKEFMLVPLFDRLCGLVVRVLGYRSEGLGSIPGTPRKKKKKKNVVGLERGPLSLVSTTDELLDRKVAAPV
jgi:hypothetical protein